MEQQTDVSLSLSPFIPLFKINKYKKYLKEKINSNSNWVWKDSGCYYFFHFSVCSRFLQKSCIACRIRGKINSISEAKLGHRSAPSCRQRTIFLVGILAACVLAHNSPSRNVSYTDPQTNSPRFTCKESHRSTST